MVKSSGKVTLTSGGDPNYRPPSTSSKKKKPNKQKKGQGAISYEKVDQGQDPLEKLYYSNEKRKLPKKRVTQKKRNAYKTPSSRRYIENRKIIEARIKELEEKKRLTQKDEIIKLFLNNNNKPLHYKDITKQTGIIVHNVRRIMGQNVAGKTKSPEFQRVEAGIYKLIENEIFENNIEIEPSVNKNRSEKINDEIFIRKDLYTKFRNQYSSVEITHKNFDSFQERNDYTIYRGQAGIYRDNNRTSKISQTPEGLVVSILSTPLSIYGDLVDWENGELIYMYPQTKRHPSFDNNEVMALRSNFKYNIPFFYIYSERNNKNTKEIWLGWVVDDHPESERFLVKFSDKYIKEEILIDSYEIEEDYEPHTKPRKKVSSKTTSRPGQAKFRFKLMQRYGTKCAFCDISEEKLLEAAHLIPVGDRHNGSDHPGNGLMLCRNCHKLQEEGLVLIEPDTYKLRTKQEGMTLLELKISRKNLNHLDNKPNQQSLKYLYNLKLKK